MKGLSKSVIKKISKSKNEPDWMLEIRLKALEHYLKSNTPSWGVDLSSLKDSQIDFFIKPTKNKARNWEEVPSEMKQVYEDLKIPESERKFLAGVETQFDSNVVYGKIKKKWEDQGVIFTNTEDGLQKHPELFKKWFGRVVPYSDNKYAALNTACWSGGSFVYIPKGVKVELPLQAYFYIKTKSMGQFERTMIIADEGAEVHYVEGCSAPIYNSNSLHTGVIELIALENAKIRYTTVQNWSKNIFNLVTQRGLAFKNSRIEWVDCNIGSKSTMKYPSVILNGDNSSGEVLSISVADEGQWQDTGGKMTHVGKNTSSTITTKSICKNGGRTSYRGLIKIPKGAKNSKSKVVCDALILDNKSQTDTYPTNDISEISAYIEHEASVSKISEKQLFYSTSRGLTEEQSRGLLVAGFLEPVTKELPMEYAMEMNELIRMSMEGSVG
ncbi:Fe-S cluster assembly protein SufB [Candidatus Dojkabacteria bacterium]|uniref:Fe-S cluster assembly protein SufB n=1 Tax=Candidatus Dojkabacteria bacterium TaxID=2099670 RepID=A0A955LAB9_9BACT|nr:Fe-S cluster assembly protein SufB [Candidatus Dojkabacteria bacterium]